MSEARMSGFDARIFGQRLRALRGDRNVEEMSRLANVPWYTYRRIERGLVEKPALEDVVKIGKAHGLTPNQMASLAGVWVLPEDELPDENGFDVDLQIWRNRLAEIEPERRALIVNLIEAFLTSQAIEAQHRREREERTGRAVLPAWAHGVEDEEEEEEEEEEGRRAWQP